MPPFHMFSSAPPTSSFVPFSVSKRPFEEQSIDFDRNPYEDYYTSDTETEDDEPAYQETHPSYQLTQELFSGALTVSESFIKTLPHYFHSLASRTAPAVSASRSKDDFNLSPEPSKLQRDLKMRQENYERVDYLQFPFQSHLELLMPTWSAVVAERVPRSIGDLMREAVFDFEEGELMPGLDYEGNQRRLENVLWRVWGRSRSAMTSEGPVVAWSSKRKAMWRQHCEASDLAFDTSVRDRHPRARPCFEPWLYGPIIGFTQPSSYGSPVSTRLETPGSLKSCLKLPSVHVSAEVEILGNMLGEHVDDCSTTDIEHESSNDSDDDKENARPTLLRTTSLPPILRRSSNYSVKSPIMSRILEAPQPLLGRVAAVAQRKIASKRKHRTRSESPAPSRRIEFNNVVDRRVIIDPEGSTTEAEAEGGSSGNEESSEEESDDEDRALSDHLRAARLRAGKKVHEHRRSASAPHPSGRTPPPKRRPRSLTAPIEPVTLAPAHEVPEPPRKAFFDPSWMPEEVAEADVFIYGDGADSSSDEEAGFDWGSQRIAMRRGGFAKRRATWAPSKTTGQQRRHQGAPRTVSLPATLSPRQVAVGLTRSASSSSSLSSLSTGLGLRVSSSNLQQLKYQKQATDEALVRRPMTAPTISVPRLHLIREHPVTMIPVLHVKPQTTASKKSEQAWIEHQAQVAQDDDDYLGPGYWNATPTPSSSPAPQHLFHRKVDCSDILPKTVAPKPLRWSAGISSVSALRSLLERSKPTSNRSLQMPSTPGSGQAPVPPL